MTGELTNTQKDTAIEFRQPEVDVEERENGVLILRHPERANLTGLLIPQVLQTHADLYPERVFLKQRFHRGWSSITYGEFRDRATALGEGLIACGLPKGAIVVVAAENSIENALVSMATIMSGGVVAPIAPQMLSGNSSGVQEACRTLDAFALVCDEPIAGLEASARLSISLHSAADGWLDLSDLADCGMGRSDVARRSSSLTGDSPAKIFFTSGSTGSPKAVVNTHGMISAAQDISRQLFTQIKPESDEIYHLTDWLPWHHTYGGNSNFNGVLWQAGVLVIDPGKPAPGFFAETVRSLKAEPPSVYIGVPASFAMLVEELEADDEFASNFFSKVRALVSGGAALAPSMVEQLKALSFRATGAEVLMGGGYGMTETCAMITQIYWQGAAPDTLGLPPPGIELKLVPYDDDRFECRVRGPNVTPGYFNLEGPQTGDMFDEEGFFITGDTVSFVDATKPEQGLVFAGRAKEEFKLATGTWVRAGQLRAELVDTLSPLVKDVVIVGENRDDVRALLWLDDELAMDTVKERLARLASTVRGQSRRVVAAAPLETPPDPAKGEITAKGTLNQIRLRRNRIHEISELYNEPVPNFLNK